LSVDRLLCLGLGLARSPAYAQSSWAGQGKVDTGDGQLLNGHVVLGGACGQVGHAVVSHRGSLNIAWC